MKRYFLDLTIITDARGIAVVTPLVGSRRRASSSSNYRLDGRVTASCHRAATTQNTPDAAPSSTDTHAAGSAASTSPAAAAAATAAATAAAACHVDV